MSLISSLSNPGIPCVGGMYISFKYSLLKGEIHVGDTVY